MQIKTLRKIRKILWFPLGLATAGGFCNLEVWGTDLIISIVVIVLLSASMLLVQVKIDRHPDGWKEN